MKNKNKKRLKERGEKAEGKGLTNCSEEKHGYARKLMFPAAAGAEPEVGQEAKHHPLCLCCGWSALAAGPQDYC